MAVASLGDGEGGGLSLYGARGGLLGEFSRCLTGSTSRLLGDGGAEDSLDPYKL